MEVCKMLFVVIVQDLKDRGSYSVDEAIVTVEADDRNEAERKAIELCRNHENIDPEVLEPEDAINEAYGAEPYAKAFEIAPGNIIAYKTGKMDEFFK
jgi:hypothetical protein